MRIKIEEAKLNPRTVLLTAITVACTDSTDCNDLLGCKHFKTESSLNFNSSVEVLDVIKFLFLKSLTHHNSSFLVCQNGFRKGRLCLVPQPSLRPTDEHIGTTIYIRVGVSVGGPASSRYDCWQTIDGYYAISLTPEQPSHNFMVTDALFRKFSALLSVSELLMNVLEEPFSIE